MNQIPYWRLSGFYFFYFAALGSLLPYWTLYLEQLGFSKLDVGLLMSIFMSARIFSPFIFAHLADHISKPNILLKVASILMLLSFIPMTINGLSFTGLAIFLFILGFLFSGTIPQLEALTLRFTKSNPSYYSKIRLWGSVGFAIAVSFTGYILDLFSIDKLPWIIGLILFAHIIVSFLVPDKKTIHKSYEKSILPILLKPAVIVFLIVGFLHQASHGAYYIYFSIYLSENGFDKTVIGALWSLGVVAEIILFIYLSKFINKTSPYNFLLWALALTTLRWVLAALFIDNLALLILSQLLHAASFGLFHVVGISYVSHFFPDNMQSRGQAIFAIASFGIGALVGGTLASLAWKSFGGMWVFLASALSSLIAGLLWVFYKNYYKEYTI